jgi:actin-like ATPase involved in cell morphogenesis
MKSKSTKGEKIMETIKKALNIIVQKIYYILDELPGLSSSVVTFVIVLVVVY